MTSPPPQHSPPCVRSLLSPLPSQPRSTSTPCKTPNRPLNTFSDLSRLSPFVRSLRATPVTSDSSRSLSKSFCFGSKSRPSPLDRIRGLEATRDLSASVDLGRLPTSDSRSFDRSIRGFAKLCGRGLESVSFSTTPTSGAALNHSASTSSSWLFQGLAAEGVAPSLRNPHKALLTIDQNSTILVANKRACDLFLKSSSDLVGQKLASLIERDHGTAADEKNVVEEILVDEFGELESVSGRVVQAKLGDGSRATVSLWMRKLSSNTGEPRFLAVLEGVARIAGVVACSSSGRICWCDSIFSNLHGFTQEELRGKRLANLMMSVDVEQAKESKCVHVTTRTKHGQTLPASLVPCKKPTEQYFERQLSDSFGSLSLKRQQQQGFWGPRASYSPPPLTSTSLPCSPSHHTSKDRPFSKALSQSVCEYPTTGGSSLSTSISPSPPSSITNVNNTSNPKSPKTPLRSHILSSASSSTPSSPSSLRKVQAASTPKPQNNNNELTQPPRTPPNYSTPPIFISETTPTSSSPPNELLREAENSSPLPEEPDMFFSVHVYHTMSGLVSFDGDGKIFGFNNTFVLLLLGYSETELRGQPITRMLPDFHNEANVLDNSFRGLSRLSPQDEPSISEGSFVGFARHKDGSKLRVSYQVKKVLMGDQTTMYCAWICRDSTFATHAALPSTLESLFDDFELQERRLSQSFSRSMSSVVSERHSPIQEEQPILLEEEADDDETSKPAGLVTPSNEDLLEKELISGEFSNHYESLEQIGKGSFGFVRRALRRSDKQVVVVKYINKCKVLAECWEKSTLNLPVLSNDFKPGMAPRELLMLNKLDHPKIVRLLDIFHNPTYFQMVMQQHGEGGFDLFEFIEENPDVDEAVASFIFRQVVAAVDYLHSNGIVHRDIKDENIILDLHFQVQLIDFGSAAYMQEGKLFDTFCGTLEYCAPEVLQGNPYPGPELEIFSMGVTLYTLIFGENPFFDVEETIAGILRPPFEVTGPCSSLLLWILEPNPQRRISMAELLRHPWITMDVEERIDAIVNDPQWIRPDQPPTHEDDAFSDTEEQTAFYSRVLQDDTTNNKGLNATL
eukprot:m.204174 g.204174  ORF g.204174 m.204174 type:complete len:1076 (-) comp26019_c0_seq5:66-3293(-)